MENKNNKEHSKNNIAPLQIFLSCEIEDMIEEDIALGNIDKTAIPINEYLSCFKDSERYIDIFSDIANINKVKERIKPNIANVERADIANQVVTSALITLFDPFYKENLDDNFNNFISPCCNLFFDIAQTKIEDTFANDTSVLPENLSKINTLTLNMANILHSILAGKIKIGDNVTTKLFKNLSKEPLIFAGSLIKSFMKICLMQNGKYIVKNDDISSLDYKIAVLSLIKFKQPKNDLIFARKIKQYLDNLNVLS